MASGGTYTFDVLALRRADELEDQANAAGWHSLVLGRRLARLVAEAPEGCQLRVRTAGAGTDLAISIVVSARGPIRETRAGLADTDAVVEHLAHEAAGLLSEAAMVGPVRPLDDRDIGPGGPASDSDPRIAALRVTPRGPGFGMHPAGYLGVPSREEGLWAVARASDPGALARLLLANPHLALVQSLSPLGDAEMEQARAEMADEVGGAVSDHEEFLGTPVRVRTSVESSAAPWTLPLRMREHLRSWFSAVDLEEVPLGDLGDGGVVPEHLAAGLMRFPATVETAFPGMRVEPRVVPFEGEAPTEEGVRAGVARSTRDELCDIVLTDEALSRHVHVIGETGSGKSTLLTALALQTADRGQGFLFLDPHGQTVDRILSELDPKHRDRVWLIRCGDTTNPVRLNPFSVGSADERELVIGDMTEAFQQLFDPKNQGIVGPRFQRTMRNILMSLADVRGDRASLLDVTRLLDDDDMAKSLAGRLSDPALKSFWRNDLFGNRSNELNEIKAWVASKFGAFAGNPAIRAMLETGEDSFDPAEAMADNRIILLDLAKGEVGITGSRVLGMLYLIRFWSAALNRADRHPFTLFVDEAGSFSAVPLAAILAEGRKFGLRAVIAHQYMAQFVEQLVEAVEGSVATRAIFRVGHDDARALAVATVPEFSPLDLTGMPQFTAAVRLADSGNPLRPFTLEVDHNERVCRQPDADVAAEAIRDRTIADLVDPFRGARRFDTSDLSDRHPAPGANQRPEFLDKWLAEREAQRRPADLGGPSGNPVKDE